MNDTTRRFARTLREIDPVLYRSSIEHFPAHGKSLSRRAINWTLALAVLVVIYSVGFVGAAS